MSSDFVVVDRPRPHVALVTLNRPERMNSMAFDVMLPLKHALDEITHDNAVRAVVLTGVPESATSDQLDEYLEYLLSLLGRRVMGGFAAESDAMLR